MATLLGLVDDQTVLAYLGRPEYIKEQKIDQTVRYIKSGTVVNKRHYFRHRLKAKKGYIERFEAGYVYVKDGEWLVHWNHEVQLTLPESEGLEQRVSKEGFSLHKIRDEDIEIEPTETRTEINETEKRECI
ncbi:MAG: hypothetical protein QMD13_05980 [Candidatus Bathyarchaeia archaeon]|nr:hypothetical protein [Candidatus Bathyarchaeia archaeon]